MSSDTPEGFRPADERWAAVKRTQRRMSAPPGGEDIGALLAQSMEAYWTQREQETHAEMVKKTPEAFRRAAALFRRDFLSDFTLASTPMAAVLLTYPILREAEVLLPDWFPWLASGLALALFVSAWLVRLRLRHMAWLRYSMGALAAGLLMSVVLGVYMFQQAKTNTYMTLFVLQGELEDIAVSSLRSKVDTGDYLNARVSNRLLSVETAKISDHRAIYKASAASFPGELVAELGLRSGQVRWTARNQDSLQLALAAGKLTKATDDAWIVRANGRDLQLRADARVLGFQPRLGDCLVVAYNPDPEYCTVRRAVRLDVCSPEANDGEDATTPHAGWADGRQNNRLKCDADER